MQYALQPYNDYNALWLNVSGWNIDHPPTGFLTLTKPGQYRRLAIAAASTGIDTGPNGRSTGTVVLHFADGTSSRKFVLTAPDAWTTPNRAEPVAIAGLGRSGREGDGYLRYDSGYGSGFGLYETVIDLVRYGWEKKTLDLLEFTMPSEADSTGNFAVSGEENGPSFTSIDVTPDGMLSLKLEAPADMRIRIESSTDLVNWTEVTTVTSPDGTIEVSEPITGNSQNKFYRAVLSAGQ